jgi:hypothetical protein
MLLKKGDFHGAHQATGALALLPTAEQKPHFVLLAVVEPLWLL